MVSNKNPGDRLQEIVERQGYGYTLETKEKAKAMFLSLCSPDEIAKKLQVEITTVRKWIASAEWQKQQAKVVKSFVGPLLTRRVDELENIRGLGLAVASRYLAQVWRDKPSLSVKDVEHIIEMVMKVDKLIKLEEGKPTDIVKNISMKEAKERMRKVLKEDPFEEFKDVVEVDKDGRVTKH